MSRNLSGVYSLPAGSIVSTGDTILPTQHNTPLNDIASDLNLPRPIVAGGTGASSASAALVNLGFSGIIVMWSGAISAIPTGWALCDGTSGTPNLTGKFIVHADADSGGTYAPGDTGGADSVTLTEAQMPAHIHSVNINTTVAGAHAHTVSFPGATSADQGGSGASNATETLRATSSNGDHSHNVSGNTASTGGGGSHENRPPYYALAYIMKL